MLITNNFSTLLTTEPNKKIPMNEIRYPIYFKHIVINYQSPHTKT